MKSSICLDLTRLISRSGTGSLTGVDRVELAYLEHFIRAERPVFGWIKLADSVALLDKRGLIELRRRICGETDWGKRDMVGYLSRRLSVERQRAESFVRSVAIKRAPRFMTKKLWQKFLSNTWYFNTGHSNLRRRDLQWIRSSGAKIAILIHDTIPLDFPEFQRPNTVESFRKKLSAAADMSDLLIFNSDVTRSDVERHVKKRPKTVVAHLGISLTEPGELPHEVDAKDSYFVAISTIEPRKNHAFLLDLWSQMPTNNRPKLFLIGRRGWQNQAVFSRLDALSPADDVVELGALSDAETLAVLQGACGLLFPSLAEGFGLPPVEAAAVGVPVISNDLPVLREIMGNYPIFINLTRMDLWYQEIARCIALKKNAQHTRAQEPPTWAAHFNSVFRILDADCDSLGN